MWGTAAAGPVRWGRRRRCGGRGAAVMGPVNKVESNLLSSWARAAAGLWCGLREAAGAGAAQGHRHTRAQSGAPFVPPPKKPGFWPQRAREHAAELPEGGH